MKAKTLTRLGITAASGALAAEPQVPYPEGYRDWHHVKSMVIEAGHPLHGDFGGIHHIYANDKALEGYRGDRFPDGAVIIFDLLEAVEADNAVTEGSRKHEAMTATALARLCTRMRPMFSGGHRHASRRRRSDLADDADVPLAGYADAAPDRPDGPPAPAGLRPRTRSAARRPDHAAPGRASPRRLDRGRQPHRFAPCTRRQ
jgi:hypothetical protein